MQYEAAKRILILKIKNTCIKSYQTTIILIIHYLKKNNNNSLNNIAITLIAKLSFWNVEKIRFYLFLYI